MSKCIAGTPRVLSLTKHAGEKIPLTKRSSSKNNHVLAEGLNYSTAHRQKKKREHEEYAFKDLTI